jgi:glutaredoxin
VVPALIVTKEDCPWCVKLKETLTEDSLVYEEITKEEAVEKGYWKDEWTTVPQLWLYKQHIGGYNDYIAQRQTSDANSPSHEAPEKVYDECASCES